MKRFANKTLLLSTILLLLLLALPVSALADSGEDENEFTQIIDGYQVTLVFEKPATVGANLIHVRLNDAQNMPIPAGNVEVSVIESASEHSGAATSHNAHQMADMPEQPAEASHNGHSEMGMTALTAGHHSGEYTGEIAIEADGDCVIRVHLIVDGVLTEADFPVNIAQPQNGAGILAGFFALNVAIIATALISKPKLVPVISTRGA
jgi:hypothetical protein